MKVYRTAALTAVWRYMAKVDERSIAYVNIPLRLFAYILGLLDPNSVATISERTKMINLTIKKIKPKYIVEIVAGFSSRAAEFDNIRFYELDLPYFQKFKDGIISFNIGKDDLKLNVKDALFIIEGVTMYLQKGQVLTLLRQIKKYKGHILIDFFSKEYSEKEKNLREKIYKMLFRIIIQKTCLFDYRMENLQEGITLLKKIGFKNVKHYNYKVPKTLDCLFYAKL